MGNVGTTITMTIGHRNFMNRRVIPCVERVEVRVVNYRYSESVESVAISLI